MPFHEYFEAVPNVLRANLPVAVGGTVAVLVLTYLFFQNRRPRGRFRPVKPPPADADNAATWAPPEQSYADRRGTTRREGAPVRVMLSSTAFRSGLIDGYVVDRSTGGLKVVTQVAVAPGSTMQVRAANAPDTVGYVTLIIRSCRKETDHFVVGCEFEKTPPWNVLLLFG